MARTTGICRHHRDLFRNNPEYTVRELLETFKLGQHVSVAYNSSAAFSARPHPRLNGRSGQISKVLPKNNYVVKIAKKEHIISRAHLHLLYDR